MSTNTNKRSLLEQTHLIKNMAEGFNKSESKRIAVVTGANKGIGLEICKQLAYKGIVVVLTARDENRGKEALDNIRGSGLSDYVVFHKLDVADPTSVASLADFVKTQFGKLDILVNNAGIGFSSTSTDPDALKATMNEVRPEEMLSKFKEINIENYELAVQCLETNYFGAKRMVEAFIPLLQLSNSPRIVNVSSSIGKLKNVKNEWAIQIFTDVENLSEEKVDEVVNAFLKDCKEDSHKAKGWPDSFSAYIISKAAMNAYTRILAKKYPTFCINSVCPGFVKTDLNYNTGILSVEQGAETPVKMALLPDGGPTGLFFDRNGVSSFD